MLTDQITLQTYGIKTHEPAGYTLDSPGHAAYLFEYFETPVTLEDTRGRRRYDGNIWILYSPDHRRYYQAFAPLTHTWFHMSGPGLEECLDRYRIQLNTAVKIASPLFLISFLEQARLQAIGKQAYAEDAVTLLSRAFFRDLARTKPAPQRAGGPSSAHVEELAALRHSRALIHADISRHWNLDEMAALVNLSTSHYATRYQRYFHVSPYQDLIQARMRRMQLLLRFSNLSIEAAAERCGFGSPSRFYAHYRRRVGQLANPLHRGLGHALPNDSDRDAEERISLLFVEPAAYWSFDSEDGNPKQDFLGKHSPLEFKPGVKITPGHGGGGALTLRFPSYAELQEPVIDTKQSFTVCAWVWCDTTELQRDWMTAVSIGNENHCNFYLQYSEIFRAYLFTVTPSGLNSGTIHARGVLPLVDEQWVHLTGVHDQERKQITLWENGVLSRTLPFETPWTAPGPTRIGVALFSGSLADFWLGKIDDVRLYQRALRAKEIQRIASFDKGRTF